MATTTTIGYMGGKVAFLSACIIWCILLYLVMFIWVQNNASPAWPGGMGLQLIE